MNNHTKYSERPFSQLHPQEQERMITAAKNAAAADPSDPFAFSRAMSHLKSGVAGYRYGVNGQREDAFADAQPSLVPATDNEGNKLVDEHGTTLMKTVYSSQRRA